LIKAGRAELVSGHEIRLMNSRPPIIKHFLEENMSDTNNIIYRTFDPRKWKPNPLITSNNKAERTFITGIGGKLTEVYCLGDWNWHWSEIENPRTAMKSNTDCVFTFWLNGGENDRNDEVCQLKIIFNGDEDNAMTFKLNRHYIKPEKHIGGWYRYEIPFKIPEAGEPGEENVIVQLKFAAMSAPCAIMPDNEEFAELSGEEFPDPKIPQRSNIVFNDGYPRDAWWSHLIFGESTTYSENKNNDNQGISGSGMVNSFTFDFKGAVFEEGFDFSKIGETIREAATGES